MCSHSFTATEHRDPGWKIAGGGLATKFSLWNFYFEDSRKKITLNYYEVIRGIRKKEEELAVDERLPASTFTGHFSHFDCEFVI